MLPALLTAVLFALSAIFASRTTRLLGGARANLFRLILATCLLGMWSHGVGGGLGGGGLGWFLLSGCVGFGFGDMALYAALPRLGPRLATLLVHCLASPFAVGVEWVWLGTTLDLGQLAASGLILAGVGLVLFPGGRSVAVTDRGWWLGVLLGVVAAVGQGGGAVLSRKAYEAVAGVGGQIDGGTAAYQRIVGGIFVVLVVQGVFHLWGLGGGVFRQEVSGRGPGRSGGFAEAWRWIVLNSCTGPVLGVACYQWALRDHPSGVVLPIVATTPLMVIPLSAWWEGDRPGLKDLGGSLMAVAGAAYLVWSRAG